MPRSRRASIPSGYVPKDYQPSSADNILSGQLLRVGMVVLLRYGKDRGDPAKFARLSKIAQTNLPIRAQWCRIDSLTPAPPRSSQITFTATYADGTSRTRTALTLSVWIVKKASMG